MKGSEKLTDEDQAAAAIGLKVLAVLVCETNSPRQAVLASLFMAKAICAAVDPLQSFEAHAAHVAGVRVPTLPSWWPRPSKEGPPS